MNIKNLTVRALSSLALVALVLTAFASLFSERAHAGETGELEGYVVDDAGLPVVGARVILTSPQMIGGNKTEATDADGRFRFPNLDVGVYTVEISHADFRGFKEENIEIGISAKVVKDYLLEAVGKAETGEQVIRVVATAPIVDTTRTSEGMSIRPDFTDRTVTSRDYQGVALFVPGVVDGAAAPGNPSIHGGLAVSNLYLLDGLNITDPVVQTFSTNFNFDSIGEEQVLTGALDAEYGGFSGGVINIVTKSGGDDFTLDGSIYWSPKELILNDPTEVPSDSNTIDANLAVGGPIIKKKLWFFVSGEYIDNVATTPFPAGQTSPFPDVKSINPFRFNSIYGLGKLKWQVLPWEKVSLLVQGDPTWITNETQSIDVHPDAESQRFQGGVKIIATSETTLSENLFWKTQVGYANNRIHDFPMSDDFSKPGHSNEATGTSTVNESSVSDDQRYRAILGSSLTYFLENFVGDHEIKAGVEGTVVWNTSIFDVTGNPKDCLGHHGCTFLDNGIANAGSTINGVGDPFQITVYDAPLDKTVSANTVSAYVQDVWRPFRSLTIRPGLRFDSSRAYNDAGDGGDEVYGFNTLSPRIGAAWDPLGDGKTVIRAGFYQYREDGLLEVPSFVGRSQASKTFQFDAATNAYTQLISSAGGDAAVVFKPGMQAPLTNEVVFGVEREIFEDAKLEADFTYRRRQNSFEDDESNIIWNAAGDNAVGFHNGQPTFIFSVGTPDNAMGQYEGVDLLFEKRLSDNWQALVSYTLSRDEGTNEEYATAAFDNPRQAPFEYGFLADDIRHNARATLSYDLPFGFGVGGTVIYRTGRPDSKFFLNNFYGAFQDRRAPRGFDPKNVDDPTDDVELRLPDQFFTNIRLTWRLKELTTQDIWLIADISNVFDSRPITSIEDRNEPAGAPTQFGDPTGRGGPTSATVAIRYQF